MLMPSEMHAPKTSLERFISAIISSNLNSLMELTKSHPQLHPFAMALCSIHSAEFFRESILSFAASVGSTTQEVPNRQSLIESDEMNLKILREILIIFASTSGAHKFEISDLAITHWRLYVCIIASLLKPSQAGGTPPPNGSLFLLRLGDELVRRGKVMAGQICILLSGSKDNVLDSVDNPNGLVCLIGVDHRSIGRVLDPHGLLLSEMYEYSWRVNAFGFSPAAAPGASDPPGVFASLQPFKFAYAAFLAGDLGMFDLAIKYLELVNAFLRSLPTNRYSIQLRTAMRDLEMRIMDAGFNASTNGRQSVVGISDVGQAALGAIWGGITAVARTSRMI